MVTKTRKRKLTRKQLRYFGTKRQKAALHIRNTHKSVKKITKKRKTQKKSSTNWGAVAAAGAGGLLVGGALGTIAGDGIKSTLNNAYNWVDSKVGGLLPDWNLKKASEPFIGPVINSNSPGSSTPDDYFKNAPSFGGADPGALGAQQPAEVVDAQYDFLKYLGVSESKMEDYGGVSQTLEAMFPEAGNTASETFQDAWTGYY